MLSQIFIFILQSFGKCINVFKSFTLDTTGGLRITYFHFLIFVVFMAIVIRVINYIKQVQEVEESEELQKLKRKYKK